MWLGRWPRYWDIIFHRRPMRRRETALEKKIAAGYFDADAIPWPVVKKPHKYYW